MAYHSYEVLDSQHPFKNEYIALFDDGLWSLIKFEHNHWIVWIDIDLTKYWVNIPLEINELWKDIHHMKGHPQPVEKDSVATITIDKIEALEPLDVTECCSFCWEPESGRCDDSDCHCHEPHEVKNVRKGSSKGS